MDIPQIVAGRFRIECEIGKGGMGTVYRASHLGLERPVAVKVLKKEFAADPEVAERFMREARTMARLRHPRAAMIFDAGRLADGRPFIVMEYVEGQTLAETLESDGRFAPERAVRVASEICEVLAEAHALGIVHRDLKPSNIMLNERGVCVLDFGIAKVLASSAEATKTFATTESGLVIGTPRYMSPEQCMGQKVGPSSDLYSVGVLVYEMLAGRPPFTDLLASAVLVKQTTSAPPPLLALRPDLPRSLAIATHTLLAKNPAQRPGKASEVRVMLAKSIAPPPRQSDAATETQPFASTIATLNNRASVLFRVATVCAAIVMLGALLFAWSGDKQTTSAAAPETETTPRSDARARNAATRRTASGSVVQAKTLAKKPPARLSADDAQRIAETVTRASILDARILRTGSAQAIAVIQKSRTSDGAAQFSLLERRGGLQYQLTMREPLDVAGFRGENWTMEVVDIDGDGIQEVLCTGEKLPLNSQNRRFVLYVPRMRETYILRIVADTHEPNTISATWSANAMTHHAHPYRTALRQRVLETSKAY